MVFKCMLLPREIQLHHRRVTVSTNNVRGAPLWRATVVESTYPARLTATDVEKMLRCPYNARIDTDYIIL